MKATLILLLLHVLSEVFSNTVNIRLVDSSVSQHFAELTQDEKLDI